MITHTISLLELITALLLIGAIVAVGRALWLRLGDNERLHRRPDFIYNGPRHRQVKINIRNSLFDLVSYTIFLLAVGVLMTQPPAYGSAYSPGAVLVILAIMSTIIGGMVDTLMYLYNRERILEELQIQDTKSAMLKNIQRPDLTPRNKVIIEDDETTGLLIAPVDVERQT